VGNCNSRPTILEFAGRRCLQTDTKIVQSTWSGQSYLQCRVEDALAVTKEPLHVLDREALHEILRGNTSPSGKQAVKMERTESDITGEIRQRRLLGMVLIEVTDHT